MNVTLTLKDVSPHKTHLSAVFDPPLGNGTLSFSQNLALRLLTQMDADISQRDRRQITAVVNRIFCDHSVAW